MNTATLPPLPVRMARLPLDRRGLPIFWTAHVDGGTGEPDFRVLEHERVLRAIKQRLCGMCGQRIEGNVLCFIGADGNLLQRRSTDPAMHEACARFAIAACPFLSGRAVRRSGRPIEGLGKSVYRSAEHYDRERPPRTGLFFTRSYEARWRPEIEGFRYAQPFRVEWFDL